MHGDTLTIDGNIVNIGDETIGETNIKGTKINLGDHSKVFVNKDGNEVSLQDYVGSTSVDTTKVTDIATAIEKEGQVISIGTQVKKDNRERRQDDQHNRTSDSMDERFIWGSRTFR